MGVFQLNKKKVTEIEKNGNCVGDDNMDGEDGVDGSEGLGVFVLDCCWWGCCLFKNWRYWSFPCWLIDCLFSGCFFKLLILFPFIFYFLNLTHSCSMNLNIRIILGCMVNLNHKFEYSFSSVYFLLFNYLWNLYLFVIECLHHLLEIAAQTLIESLVILFLEEMVDSIILTWRKSYN